MLPRTHPRAHADLMVQQQRQAGPTGVLPGSGPPPNALLQQQPALQQTLVAGLQQLGLPTGSLPTGPPALALPPSLPSSFPPAIGACVRASVFVCVCVRTCACVCMCMHVRACAVDACVQAHCWGGAACEWAGVCAASLFKLLRTWGREQVAAQALSKALACAQQRLCALWHMLCALWHMPSVLHPPAHPLARCPQRTTQGQQAKALPAGLRRMDSKGPASWFAPYGQQMPCQLVCAVWTAKALPAGLRRMDSKGPASWFAPYGQQRPCQLVCAIWTAKALPAGLRHMDSKGPGQPRPWQPRP